MRGVLAAAVGALAASLLLSPALAEEPPDPAGESARLAALSGMDGLDLPEIHRAGAEGRTWTAERAAAARERLAADPGDLAERLRSMAWARAQPDAAGEHRALLLGLIERHGAEPIASAVPALLLAAAADETTWAAAEEAWRARAAREPGSAAVLANAGYFLTRRGKASDARRAEGIRLLERAHGLVPDDWRWTSVLANDAAFAVLLHTERATENDVRRALALFLDLARTAPATPPEKQVPGRYSPVDLQRTIATIALRAGDLDAAERAAGTALAEAEKAPAWDRPNVVHQMRQVLGHVALRRGDTAAAVERLLESARHDGSPQLASFGPHFELARDLLAKGERAAVLEYLDLCAKFWTSGRARLAEWRNTLQEGGTPEFVRSEPPEAPVDPPSEAPPPPPAERPAGFAGLWESVSSSRGGIGSAIDLRQDGTASSGLVVIVEVRWAIDGERLELREPGGKEVTSQPLGRFEGDEWRIEAAGRTVVRRRTEPATPGAPTVVGTWSYQHDTGTVAHERYDASGRLSMRVPMPAARTGRWSSAGGTLRLAFAGEPEVALTATLREDRLALTDPDGETTEYRYAGAKAWYALTGRR